MVSASIRETSTQRHRRHSRTCVRTAPVPARGDRSVADQEPQPDAVSDPAVWGSAEPLVSASVACPREHVEGEDREVGSGHGGCVRQNSETVGVSTDPPFGHECPLAVVWRLRQRRDQRAACCGVHDTCAAARLSLGWVVARDAGRLLGFVNMIWDVWCMRGSRTRRWTLVPIDEVSAHGSCSRPSRPRGRRDASGCKLTDVETISGVSPSTPAASPRQLPASSRSSGTDGLTHPSCVSPA